MPATKFDKPVFPGAKLVSATVTVTNTSGSYSNTFTDERIAASMRAFQLEIEDPSVFNDKISITTADGSFTIACDSVAGETDVTVGFLKIADDPTAVTSTEFTVLNNRIGNLESLETTDKTSMVNAVNEVVGDVSDNSQAIANLGNVQSEYLSSVSGVTYARNNIYKQGNVVSIYLIASKSQWAESDVIAIIPAGYRPSWPITTTGVNYNMPSDNLQIGINDATGEIKIWNKGVQAQGNIYVFVTYVQFQ